MTWSPAEFLVAKQSGVQQVAGYIHRGLGLHVIENGSAIRRIPPTWSLVHLGTGHALCNIRGKVAVAFPIAWEIAECGDWDWDGFRGYLNRDPELFNRANEIMARHAACSLISGTRDEAKAREIASARAGDV